MVFGGSRVITIAFVGYLAYKWIYPTPLKSPVVKTLFGDLQGIVSRSRTGRQFYEYLGIPYAQAPVGHLRFEPPEPPVPWGFVRDAGKYRPECIQYSLFFGDVTGDEDCLFLNLFVPKLDNDTEHEKLPVMVFFHGGLFAEGQASMYRPNYFMDEDVILITVQYRVAAFGFLSTDDGLVRGNMGLKDQSMSLRWVQENILNFGGDPQKVTIFGESAGGASVHYHMLSPMSKGLFHKAISQSGVAVNSWAHGRDHGKQAKRLANQLNCPIKDPIEMVACMKLVPAEDLVQVHKEAGDPLRDPLAIFLPTVEIIDDDQTFLAKHPQLVMDEGNDGVGIPWMTGVTSHEGSVFLAMILRSPEAREQLCESGVWDEKILDLLFLKPDNPLLVQEIRQHYFGADGNVCDFDQHLDEYVNMYSHPMFFNGFLKSAKQHSQHSPTYTYYYTHKGDISVYEAFLALPGIYHVLLEKLYFRVSMWYAGNKTPNMGSAHADELQYLFSDFFGNNLDDMERDFSEILVRLWTGFAKNEKTAQFMDMNLGPLHPDAKELTCLELSLSPQYVVFPHQNGVEFWSSILDEK